MHDEPFAISVVAADGVLFVTVQIPDGAERDAIDACMFRITNAFAVVEQLQDNQLDNLPWEKKHSGHCPCYVVRREFTDPYYPQKFDLALRSMATLH
jgi:hypothetical protein